jgi:Zn-dependent protease with chaperone function
VAVFVWFSNPGHMTDGADARLHPWYILTHLGTDKLLAIVGLIIGVVGLTTLFRWLDLKQGGAVIARELGGQLVQPNTGDPKQKRLLNVVEEMALASGIPAPQVYLLAQEGGINAFAAGLGLEDAVIGVTQGCIDSLNRDQLQGVIAHEFSHILNGDMRMNQKLVAILAGLLLISQTGRWILEFARSGRSGSGRDRGNSVAAFALLGLCLLLIGWLGHLFGALIRAAVSRQREFLADASAVQFTRNPQGIGAALQIIGGHTMHARIQHHRATELGHFFFGRACEANFNLFQGSWLATHPPLDERIRRILPSWRGGYLQSRPELSNTDDAADDRVSGFQGAALNADGSINFTPPDRGAAAPTPFTTAQQEESGTRTAQHRLQALAHEPADAGALILALLLDPEPALRAHQEQMLSRLPAPLKASTLNSRCLLDQVREEDYLPLLECSMPALKSLSRPQYQLIRKQMSELIHADGRVSTFEWALFQIVCNYGDVHFGLSRPPKPEYRTLASVQPFFACVVSRLIHLGPRDDDAKRKAWQEACAAAGVQETGLLPADQCQAGAFTRAATSLARAYPLLKPRLLKGLIQAARSDGILSQDERLLITALSVIMDCPLVGLA